MSRLRRPNPRQAAVIAVAVAAVGGVAAGGAALAGAASPTATTSHGPTVSVLPLRTIRTLIGSALTITRTDPTRPAPSASSTTPAPAPTTTAPAASSLPIWTGPPSNLVSATSFWHSIITSAPVASTSSAMVADLVSHVTDRYGGVAAFNAHSYDMSFVTAPAGTPTTNVAFDDCQNKGYTPAGLTGPGGQFTNVPIPVGAVPATGTDSEMAVYSPSTDQLWEFWVTQHTASGWSACWGGRIDHVSQSQGIFPGSFGATATGLADSAGMVTIADVLSGHIDHAIALGIPGPADWSTYSWPAQRSDGWSTDANPVPEGTRLRLDPSIDVTKLGLTPIGTMIAKAAQTYGFIVVDQAGAVSVVAQSPLVQQGLTGVDPWAALEGGTPDYAILKNFPWSSLQALPKDYGKP